MESRPAGKVVVRFDDDAPTTLTDRIVIGQTVGDSNVVTFERRGEVVLSVKRVHRFEIGFPDD